MTLALLRWGKYFAHYRLTIHTYNTALSPRRLYGIPPGHRRPFNAPQHRIDFLEMHAIILAHCRLTSHKMVS